MTTGGAVVSVRDWLAEDLPRPVVRAGTPQGAPRLPQATDTNNPVTPLVQVVRSASRVVSGLARRGMTPFARAARSVSPDEADQPPWQGARHE